MHIERSNDEILIRVPADMDLTGLQRLLDYIQFREIAYGSKATTTGIDNLSRQVKKDWWQKNKADFVR